MAVVARMYCEALARLQQGCNEASGTFRENLKKTGRVIEVITRSQAALQFVTVNQAIVLDTVPRFLEEFMDLRKVNVEEITASISRELGRKRRVAKYSGETVLLDPKTYGENPEDKSGNKIYERVKDLARELNNISPDEWQTLRCRGWFEDTQKEQFYFVYETPAYCEAPTKYKTLYQYVDSSFMPSVSDRIQLALTLARAMHRIHKKGWLHKGFRSDHVLFFPKKSRASRSIEDPRLVGFDFARRDHPGEYSEEVMLVCHSFTLAPSTYHSKIGLQTPIFTVTPKPFVIVTSGSPSYTIIIALGSCWSRLLCGKQ